MERVGSDRISADGARLVVESRADMPGWEVRSFRRLAIVYRGERWFVAAKARENGRFRYTLEPFDDERGDIDGGVFEYDAEYVSARDGAKRAYAAASGVRTFLLPFYPLIGLLPGAVKARLADRFGISEERTTVQSIVLEACVSLMIMAMMTIGSVGRVYGSAFGVDSIPWLANLPAGGMVALCLLVPDVVMRYARILGESRHHYGFWEWLFRREER
jgi:hypothetical protein